MDQAAIQQITSAVSANLSSSEWSRTLVLVVMTFLSALGGSFLSKYLQTKGKNLATKEDITGITNQVESVKTLYLEKLEELKAQKTQEIEFTRTKNNTVIDFIKKLAAGSHLISWLTWAATQDTPILSTDDFASYDREMMVVLSDLIGLQAAVAAMDKEMHNVLAPFAKKIYKYDIEVGKARDYFLRSLRESSPAKERINHQLECTGLMIELYKKTIAFDDSLLAEGTKLFQTRLTD